MTFNLFYLADPNGAVDGAKTLVAQFDDLASAQARAVEDVVEHFSIEQDNGDGTCTIVFIV